MKSLRIILFSISGFCLIMILTVQNVRINNLEKEIKIKDKQIERLSGNIIEYEKKCERMVDSAIKLYLNGGWENYKE